MLFRMITSINCASRIYEDLAFPDFSQPREVGYFSLDVHRNISVDKSQLKTLIPPSQPSNLAEEKLSIVDAKIKELCLELDNGFDSFVSRNDDNKEYIDPFLRWIIAQKQNTEKQLPCNNNSLKECCLNADFVCWRGLLTKLAASPYEDKDDWSVYIVYWKGVYFLAEMETERQRLQRLNMNERQRHMTYWGYKFEQFMTTGHAVETGSKDYVPVCSCEQYCSVVRSSLTPSKSSSQQQQLQHRLLFAGEVDCIDSTGKYIELKTNRMLESDRQVQNFYRFKLLKCWLQCFLIGIRRILFGFRDDDGVLLQLSDISVSEIPRLAVKKQTRNNNKCWQPNVCLNWLEKLLTTIRTNITESSLNIVYKLEYDPLKRHGEVLLCKLSSEDLSSSRNNASEFMRDWFINEFSDTTTTDHHLQMSSVN